MRTRRILGQGPSYYHVFSRVVDRRHIFGPHEKTIFRKLMRKQEKFSGVKVLTYAILSNHFHILVHVPDPKEISDQELGVRLQAIYRKAQVSDVLGQIRTYRETGRDDLAEELRRPYLNRMSNLSAFMQELKLRFSKWFNRRNDRKGTLWEERYGSVLVQGRGHPLFTMASYIELNAVRAGICKRPEHYSFCGFGEALGGGRRAREGILHLMSLEKPVTRWNDACRRYRVLLTPRTQKIDSCELQSVHDIIRQRVRYLTQGAVIGSREFVGSIQTRLRNTESGPAGRVPHPMQHADWGGLCTFRALRKEAVVPIQR